MLDKQQKNGVKYIEILIVSIIIVSLIGGYIFFGWFNKCIEDNVNNSLKVFSYNQSSNIDLWHMKNVQTLQYIKNYIETSKEDISNQYLTGICNYSTGKGYEICENGMYIGTSDDKLFKSDNCQKSVSGNIKDQDWYNEGLSRVDMNVGDIHKDDEGNNFFCITGMLKDSGDGNVKVIGTDIDVKTLKAYLNTNTIGNDYKTMVINKKKCIISSNNDEDIGKSIYDTNDNVILAALDRINLDSKSTFIIGNNIVNITECNSGDWILINYTALNKNEYKFGLNVMGGAIIIILTLLIIMITILKSYINSSENTIKVL